MIWFFIFDYYWLGYLIYLLLILVFGIAVAPVIAFVLELVMFLIFWINNFRVKGATIPGKVISVLGMISSFFLGYSLSLRLVSIKSSFILLGIMIMFSLLLKWKAIKSMVPFIHIVGSVVLLIFSLAWTIGFEMDTNTKIFYDNIAYYKCYKTEVYHTDSLSYEKSLNNGKPLNGRIYDTTAANILAITDDHIIGKYSEGDILEPYLKENSNKYANMWDAYDDITWYPVYTTKGKKGYVPNTGLKIIYYNDSAYVRTKEKSFQHTTWYAFLPEAVVDCCEFIYEKLPFYARIEVTDKSN
jgi:hypothetical protein